MPLIQKNLSLEEKRDIHKQFIEWLTPEDKIELAKKHNVIKEHVYAVLRSVKHNDVIFNDAITVMKLRKGEHRKVVNQLRDVV